MIEVASDANKRCRQTAETPPDDGDAGRREETREAAGDRSGRLAARPVSRQSIRPSTVPRNGRDSTSDETDRRRVSDGAPARVCQPDAPGPCCCGPRRPKMMWIPAEV